MIKQYQLCTLDNFIVVKLFIGRTVNIQLLEISFVGMEIIVNDLSHLING